MDMGQNMMTDNGLSIYIESRNIFYDNFSTNESFFNFLLVQQDQTKQFIPKHISHYHSFERYMKQLLPAFSVEESEKYHLLTNKNSKYLFYKFNNCTEFSNAEKIRIRHSSKVKDDIGLIKIEEKDNQFLVKKIICAVEKNNTHVIIMKKTLKLCLKLKKTIGYVDVSTDLFLLRLQMFLFSIYIHLNLT